MRIRISKNKKPDPSPFIFAVQTMMCKLSEKQSKFPRYNIKCSGNMIIHELFRVVLYHVFPASVHIISRKIDFLRDSAALYSSVIGCVQPGVRRIQSALQVFTPAFLDPYQTKQIQIKQHMVPQLLYLNTCSTVYVLYSNKTTHGATATLFICIHAVLCMFYIYTFTVGGNDLHKKIAYMTMPRLKNVLQDITIM